MALLLVFACTGKTEQTGHRAPGSGSEVTKAQLSDDELLRRWYDAMEKRLVADARRVATQQFASRDDAAAALTALTPVGFRPHPEYFQALFDDAGGPDAVARRLADHASAHGDDMARRVGAMLEHLEPVMQQAAENVQRQFPASAPAPH